MHTICAKGSVEQVLHSDSIRPHTAIASISSDRRVDTFYSYHAGDL